MTAVRIGTYNVHKCKGMDWRVSPARIAKVVKNLRADILGTQEILLSQAVEISEHIEVPFVFGRARLHAGEPYGNAVFSKLPVLSQQNYDLTVRGREARQCLRVSFQLPSGSVAHFFCVHLGTSFVERREQARVLLSQDVLLSNETNARRIIAGDFNEWTRGLVTTMLGQQFESADIVMHLKRTSTYPGVLPFMHLDHVYYDAHFRLREMHLYRTRLALVASDHLPLLATLLEASPDASLCHGSPENPPDR
ncbi:MAG: endonuclease/exonuclease/phosphatase family protein [Bryobacteraceae bacterium]